VAEQPRTVLIFAHECAPYHRPDSTIGAQRPAQFAKHLPAFGWRAIVICCDARKRNVAVAEDVGTLAAASVRAASPDESVIVPTPSLRWDGALDRAWRAVQPRPGRSALARDAVRKALTTAKLATGDYSQAWQPCAREAAIAIQRETRVDAVIGEHSPDAGLFLARWFSDRFGTPWVADFRDAVLQPLRPALRRIYRPIVRRLVGTASATVNVTPYWTELDRELFGLPAVTIPNGFDEEEFDDPLGPAADERFTVAFTGRMWPEMQLPTFLSGLARLRDMLGDGEFRELRFLYRGTHDEEVRRWATDAGVAEVLDSAPHIERRESLAMLRRAHVLLLLSIPDAAGQELYLRRGVYPGKTFEYFGARRPILCVPGDGAQLDELIARTRTGVSRRTPAEIADWLRDAHLAWKAGRELRYAPVEHEVARYTRRALTGELARLLDRVAGARRTTDRPPRAVAAVAGGIS
jgi:glycosyltransferase involved in cell wall biosynthesis